jgi:TonB family protein
MIVRLFPLFLLVLLISYRAGAQSLPADSIGTIRVKKKGGDSTSTALVTASSHVFLIAEEMPQFPAIGMSMEDFIKKNFMVPQEAFDKGISGSVLVQFLVDADGTLKNIKVKKNVPGCSACSAEALRVVKMMPPWIPGTQNGKPVPVLLSIPVKFRFNAGRE